MTFGFEVAKCAPNTWVLTGGVRARDRFWGGTVLEVEEIRRTFHRVAAGHTPANWQTERRLRRIRYSDLKQLPDPVHRVGRHPSLLLYFSMRRADGQGMNIPMPAGTKTPPMPRRMDAMFWLGRDGDGICATGTRPLPPTPATFIEGIHKKGGQNLQPTGSRPPPPASMPCGGSPPEPRMFTGFVG